MSEQTRREFLMNAALAGGAVTLGPLAAKSVAGDLLQSEEMARKAAEAQMCIARWKGQDDVNSTKIAEDLTRNALAGLGGMKRFVQKDQVIWIKPNMGWDKPPHFHANTNPTVVATLVKLCLEAGAKKVQVGDYSCNWMASAYKNSGIEDAAKAAGADVVYVDPKKFPEYEINGKVLKKWPLCKEMLDADLLINVPVVKYHGISTITGCMKNYMGVAGDPRDKWHDDIVNHLCDITAYMKPKLCVIDAIHVIFSGGTEGGNPDLVKNTNTVAAGTDIVALETLGVELIDKKPQLVKLLTTAQERGLGTMDYRSLKLNEIAVMG